ncbi:hypothetical protein VTL71DRAFT_9903 [Oculimacula yallundae]|uniref:NAD(P)-binding protein n=1 Tax=Oculimacula yallundae TaxID=86028 RepID=A0ABR4BS77_9HELO
MNYIGDHPLNLIGKVAIVTSASSEQGAAICRELLNSNANVLGVDSTPAHKSTQSSRASHFQFFQYESGKDLKGRDVLEYAAKMYGKEGVDFYIDVVDGEDAANVMDGLRREVLDVFKEKSEGVVLTVVRSGNNIGREKEEKLVNRTRELSSEFKDGRVRCNLILPGEGGHTSGTGSIVDSDTESAIKEHLQGHICRREKGGYAVEAERDVANLVLFFCTKVGSSISEALIREDGSCVAL